MTADKRGWKKTCYANPTSRGTGAGDDGNRVHRELAALLGKAEAVEVTTLASYLEMSSFTLLNS